MHSAMCPSTQHTADIFVIFCYFSPLPPLIFRILLYHMYQCFVNFCTVTTIQQQPLATLWQPSSLHHGLNVSTFEDSRVAYYIKFIRLKQTFKASLLTIIDFRLLRQIILECEKFAYPTLFKSVYLIAFFSFLRLSNLLPHSIGTFSTLEQLAKGDIFFAPPGLHILVKWSKTLQSRNKVVILKLPSISDTVICPVYHIKQLLKSVPGGQDAPLFQVLCYGRWVPLANNRVRKHLKDVIMSPKLHNRGITFHTLRKSGASLAFQGQASLQSIKEHGTWSLDTVWRRYIIQNQDGSSEVARPLAHLACP